jgi:hypothetical protein
MMDQEEKESIKSKFGEINYDGLEQLEGMYDTYQINRSIDALREVISTLQQSLDNMERLKSGADELIDGDAPFSTKHYSIDECGEIGFFAEEICDNLDCCSDMINQARERLAPLQRLIPTEDGTVYIDFKDTLDKNNNSLDDDD